MLLQEGAQNEGPGEGSCLRHFFSGGERHTQTDQCTKLCSLGFPLVTLPLPRPPLSVGKPSSASPYPASPGMNPAPRWLCASGQAREPLCSPPYISKRQRSEADSEGWPWILVHLSQSCLSCSSLSQHALQLAGVGTTSQKSDVGVEREQTQPGQRFSPLAAFHTGVKAGAAQPF